MIAKSVQNYKKNVKNENFFAFFANFLYLCMEIAHKVQLQSPMKDPKRILFISQEIYPYLDEETPIRVFNRQLPEYFQSHGFETRTFMPKFGEINERRNQLHEVIRLSGMNLIINDTDHPLLIKVASIQSARLQVYFIDNDDFFRRRKGVADEEGKEYEDNDERCIFYARGAIETVKMLRWTPDVIVCSGWMSALAPLYLKRAYSHTPFFANAKVVLNIDDQEYKTPFGTKFSQKMMIDGIAGNDVRSLAGFPVGYEELMRLAIDYSDAIAYTAPKINQRLMNYAETSGKPILSYAEGDIERYSEFCKSLLVNEKED